MKLWDKGLGISTDVEKFTVGDDYLLDMDLIAWDCIASIAHAKMLCKIGILTAGELEALEAALNEIISLSKKNEFLILQEDEDCHTAIEKYLTEKLGDTGKKIHTARSRNDQVMAALKLYMKHELSEIKKISGCLIMELEKFGNNKIPIPGYTHMRKAMPSSLKMWAAGYSGSIKSDLVFFDAAADFIDSNPLGSAAGYGTNLPVDRKMTSDLLGFRKIQETAEVQMSRGKNEAAVINAMQFIMLDLAKLSSDIILFSMPEFGFFTIPDAFTTGSSIMPQKKNPDILELIRAKSKSVQSRLSEVLSVVNGLHSGYHRDFQLTKKPLMESIEITKSSIIIMSKLIGSLIINEESCKKAMAKELYATDEAYGLVKKGMSFRDAYKEVGKLYRNS